MKDGDLFQIGLEPCRDHVSLSQVSRSVHKLETQRPPQHGQKGTEDMRH